MNARQTTLLSLLLVTALVTGWLLMNQGAITPRPQRAAQGPDLFVETMDLQVTGADGLVQYHLKADAMQHIPAADGFALQGPVVHTARDGRIQWQASARQGSVSSDGETVWLREQVEIRRLPGPDARQLEITTSELLVKPEQQTASSDQAVVIRTDAYRVEALGMDADFGNSRVELRSRVRGRFDAAG